MQSGARETSFDEKLVPVFLHEDPWNLLRLYHVYRLTLAGALLVALVLEYGNVRLGQYDHALFTWLTGTYLIMAVLSNLASYFQWPDLPVQTLFFVLLDIALLLGLIYASGGIEAGFGVLLLIPVLIPHLGHPGHVSLMLAAMTGLATIAMQVWLQSKGISGQSGVMHSGLIALFIMLIGWASNRWIRKASAMASLAKRRGVDLANLSQLNQSILDKLEAGILVVEGSGSIRHMNQTAWDMLGQPGNWRSKPLEQFAPELDHHLQHWLHKLSPRIGSFDIRHQNTTELRARFSQLGTQSRRATMINLEDTSEQRTKLQSAKLASLGQLTASIAHEIRNPLGAISHAAQLLGESPNLDKADLRLLQIIQSNARRMNLTIESVLNLSRKKNPNRERLALKLWLHEFRKDFLLQNKLREDQVSLFIEPADTVIEFDPAHLHQVIWNLCRNALKYAHEDPTRLQLDIQGGNPTHTRDIMLNIIDNGRGMSEEQRQRLFEPFFTTSTQGTGLGLFMSRELCLTNGASLEYLALPTGGSCFRIVFAHHQ
ncbi:MAG TPA: ATP-binding protein [Candidatus Thiothrix moscowensis]|uniref:two-component system sensor histidine kinase NtrB n=1 Tax=unclassified Thiothrix TaxID=2636184 RepID=UPI0025DBCC75|nr:MULTISPECIES: ATP-binding protein [unclassified Thiothrix]HRJ51153.1 ATP-binding protein [Candidatus Thiothrix moscowensis]HRJ91792.1 ATP-binding protein [Candidatus Thiothrix moscowensis]